MYLLRERICPFLRSVFGAGLGREYGEVLQPQLLRLLKQIAIAGLKGVDAENALLNEIRVSAGVKENILIFEPAYDVVQLGEGFPPLFRTFRFA